MDRVTAWHRSPRRVRAEQGVEHAVLGPHATLGRQPVDAVGLLREQPDPILRGEVVAGQAPRRLTGTLQQRRPDVALPPTVGGGIEHDHHVATALGAAAVDVRCATPGRRPSSSRRGPDRPVGTRGCRRTRCRRRRTPSPGGRRPIAWVARGDSSDDSLTGRGSTVTVPRSIDPLLPDATSNRARASGPRDDRGRACPTRGWRSRRRRGRRAVGIASDRVARLSPSAGAWSTTRRSTSCPVGGCTVIVDLDRDRPR